MRQRFEENRDLKDMRKVKEMLALGEEELFLSQHYQPLKCTDYERNYLVVNPIYSEHKSSVKFVDGTISTLLKPVFFAFQSRSLRVV
jgi:hypothetical protein